MMWFFGYGIFRGVVLFVGVCALIKSHESAQEWAETPMPLIMTKMELQMLVGFLSLVVFGVIS